MLLIFYFFFYFLYFWLGAIYGVFIAGTWVVLFGDSVIEAKRKSQERMIWFLKVYVELPVNSNLSFETIFYCLLLIFIFLIIVLFISYILQAIGIVPIFPQCSIPVQ